MQIMYKTFVSSLLTQPVKHARLISLSTSNNFDGSAKENVTSKYKFMLFELLRRDSNSFNLVQSLSFPEPSRVFLSFFCYDLIADQKIVGSGEQGCRRLL